MGSKKVVLKLDLHDDRIKQKAMKTVSVLGVESLSVDMKDQKLTVIGDVDPVCLASKLRKLCHTEIVSVGPAKEPEKKKEEPKKEEPKKPTPNLPPYYPYVYTPSHVPSYYYVRGPVEEDPNSCVIC